MINFKKKLIKNDNKRIKLVGDVNAQTSADVNIGDTIKTEKLATAIIESDSNTIWSRGL